MTETPENILSEISCLLEEATVVHREVMLPRWRGPMHGLHQTLYGYMMITFAHLDRVSAFWKGSQGDQTNRMVNFLDRYVSPLHDANKTAVKVWRHTLMHTARPRLLKHLATGKTYTWLLHWGPGHMPREQHYSFVDGPDTRKLRIGLLYLIENLRTGIGLYLTDLSNTPDLQNNFRKVQGIYASYEF